MTSAITTSISAAKDEIIDTLSPARTAPSRQNRGPKNTRFMSMQRTAVRMYVEIECHRHISSVTVADCHHVWHLTENEETWNERAKRNDIRRGYPNTESLRAGVVYWFVTSKNAKRTAF